MTSRFGAMRDEFVDREGDRSTRREKREREELTRKNQEQKQKEGSPNLNDAAY